MKKLLCTVLALTALFAFAGCVDHNDGKCDECGTEGGLINKVTQNKEGDEEKCGECWLKELGADWEKELMGE